MSTNLKAKMWKLDGDNEPEVFFPEFIQTPTSTTQEILESDDPLKSYEEWAKTNSSILLNGMDTMIDYIRELLSQGWKIRYYGE